MTTPQPFGITDEARSLLGVEGPSETRAPVTWEQIQRYCYAVDDLNPLYLDEAAAARGPHGGIIAPPLFTGVGSFKPVSLSQLRADGLPSSEGDPLRPPIPGARSRLLGSDITFLRPVRVGDALTRRSHLAELVEKLVTYVGPSLVELGTEGTLATVEEVLTQGSEAQEQLAVHSEKGFDGLKTMLMDQVEYGDEG